MSRRMVVLLSVVLGGLALLGLGVFFVAVGLDRADKLGSVIGVFIGLVGLGLSVAGTQRAQQSEAYSREAVPPPRRVTAEELRQWKQRKRAKSSQKSGRDTARSESDSSVYGPSIIMRPEASSSSLDTLRPRPPEIDSQ